MSHFYWLVSKRGSQQGTHCTMIMLYFWHCQKIIVSYLWLQDRLQQPSLNLSHCMTQVHRLGATITEIATIVSRCQYFVRDSRKSCSVFQALRGCFAQIKRTTQRIYNISTGNLGKVQNSKANISNNNNRQLRELNGEYLYKRKSGTNNLTEHRWTEWHNQGNMGNRSKEQNKAGEQKRGKKHN